MKRMLVMGVLLLSTAGVLATAQAQELLPPVPTPPAFGDIEPRTPIHQADLPLVIDSPGSYYLVEDITMTTWDDGIRIESSDVTIDLMGFTMRGGDPDMGINGIVAGTVANVVIKNGTVSGWSESGVDLETAYGALIENLVVSDNYLYGILLGNRGRVVNSVAENNGFHGIKVGAYSVVRGCIALGNEHGITVGDYSRVVDCDTRFSQTLGITAGQRATISGNHVWAIRRGILAGYGSRVTGNVAAGGLSGSGVDASITVDGGSLVLANNCRGDRILVAGGGNRIEGNNVVDSGSYGIDVVSDGNLIIKNSVWNSGDVAYRIVSGNDVGPIGSATLSTSPWANIVY